MNLLERLTALINGIASLVSAVGNLVSGDTTITNILNNCVTCDDIILIDPDPVQDPDPADPPNAIAPGDWAEYLCRSANWVYQEGVVVPYIKTEQIEQFIGSAAAISMMLGVFAATGVGLPLAALVALVAVIVAVVDLDKRADVLADIEAAKQDVICILTTSAGPSEASYEIDTGSWQSGLDIDAVAWIKASLPLTVLNQYYLGQLTALEELYPMDTPCNCTPPSSSIPDMHFNVDSDWLGDLMYDSVPVVNNDPIHEGNELYEMFPELVGGVWYMQFEFGSDTSAQLDAFVMKFTNIDGYTWTGQGVDMLIGNPQAHWKYTITGDNLTITSPPNRGTARRIQIRSTTEFYGMLGFLGSGT